MDQKVDFPGLGAAAQSFISTGPKKLLIGGEWVEAASGKTFDAIDPVTEGVICKVAEGGKEDIDRAVKAARTAFEGEWSKVSPAQRQNLMLKLADLLEKHAEELTDLESLDVGKLRFFARIIDVQGSVDSMRYNAGWATKIHGRTYDMSLPSMHGEEYRAFTVKEPVGVVGQIVPWNFPLAMAIWKIGPALATGCTCILKPAEQTPLTAIRLGELIQEAGIPAGVVNIVTGYGETAGQALIEHPDVDKIAFTGSTPVGKHIARTAADTVKRVSLELGGKSPAIVAADADLDVVLPGIANGIFFNHGQVCTAGSRLFVHRSIHDKVVEGVANIASGMRLGSGFEEGVQMGPLVSKEQMERVLGYIEKGKAQGGQVATGGERHGDSGYFVKPTVFTGCGTDSAVYREEIFGPVLVATPYDDMDEAVKMANDTDYGLAASVWSTNVSTCHRVSRKLRAGTVWVNTHNMLDPAMSFGGYKQSGFGRENGMEVLDLYTETKSIVMQI